LAALGEAAAEIGVSRYVARRMLDQFALAVAAVAAGRPRSTSRGVAWQFQEARANHRPRLAGEQR
jgi:hypothetical protein